MRENRPYGSEGRVAKAIPTPIMTAGLCPKNDESAGKRRSTRMRTGAPWLKTKLVQSGSAAMRKKGSFLQGQFYRIKARRGAKKAVCAVAASILTSAYHMLKGGTLYQEPVPTLAASRAKPRQTQSLVAKLTNLGYKVSLTPRIAA